MFGHRMWIMTDKVKVLLRPMDESDLPGVVEGFSLLGVRQWTAGLNAPGLSSEKDWLRKVEEDPKIVHWAIVPDGSDEAVGVTALNNIDGRCKTGRSGIIIYRPEWWGKGVASASHLGRTLYAADYLMLASITSGFRVQNEASGKALYGVGYFKIGEEYRTWAIHGRLWNTVNVQWVNPSTWALKFLFGDEEVPSDVRLALPRALEALTKARVCVKTFKD